MNNFLYNIFFRNKVFEIDMGFQNLQQLFEKLCGEKLVLLDRFAMVYQQIKLIRSEIRNLKSMLTRIDKDFEE